MCKCDIDLNLTTKPKQYISKKKKTRNFWNEKSQRNYFVGILHTDFDVYFESVDALPATKK